MKSIRHRVCVATLLLLLACGGAETAANPSASDATSATGGASTSGGTGTLTTAGGAMTTKTSGGTTGTTTTGRGGGPASGGTSAAGGASHIGGAVNTGGKVGDGGAIGQGGTPISAGAFALGGVTARGGTTTTMPPSCQKTGPGPISAALPQAISFRITNNDTAIRYLSSDYSCSLGLRIYSCADGYQISQQIAAGCTTSCAIPTTGCIACGACPPQAKAIASGTSLDFGWDGYLYSFSTFTTTAMACSCYNKTVPPIGKYRVVVDVYDTSDVALSFGPASASIAVDFEYPDDDGVVVVDI